MRRLTSTASENAALENEHLSDHGLKADCNYILCSWFDLDQHEVLDLKGRLLEAAGAGKKHGGGDKYPLQAATYTSAVVDLNDAAWADKLVKAGNFCNIMTWIPCVQ